MNLIYYLLFSISLGFGTSMLVYNTVKDKTMRFLTGVSISIAIFTLATKIFLN